MSRLALSLLLLAVALSGCGDDESSQPTMVLANGIPVAHTPPGGYGEVMPPAVLVTCTEPLAEEAPDLRGMWRVVSAERNGVSLPDLPVIGSLQRIEQCGDRVVITSGGVVHDMRADGTVENGVNDVAAADFVTPINVVATFEHGVHVLRPVDAPGVEVTRRRDGADLFWDYVGFTAQLLRLGPPDLDPADLGPADALCADYNPRRNAYIGDLHVHSKYSFDSVLFGVQAGPRDAYDFARGAAVALPPFDLGNMAQLRRPLDFAAVTEHSEFFGEAQICTVPGDPGFDSQLCESYRDLIAESQDSSKINSGVGLQVFINLAVALINPDPKRNEEICGPGGSNCPPRADIVWADIQSAADEKNVPCTFTTFQGYEWTANSSPQAPPDGAGLHRNVIFRNSSTPDVATSYLDAPQVEKLWDSLVVDCLENTPGCDVITIPHNSNFSSGLMWTPINSVDGSPLSQADAAFRRSMEPVAEIHQHKGSSECKPGVTTTDELCAFESLNRVGPLSDPDPKAAFHPLAYVRNALKEGLVQDEVLGVNPFQLGLIGSTDAHNADPGNTNESDYRLTGHQGANDWSAERILNLQAGGAGMESNPGGLAIVWATQNSRDALFAAIRRREVYGTSGTRPLIRSFGGDLPDDLCESPDFVGEGYRAGVPMGGEIRVLPEAKSPRLAVLAHQDPGTDGAPGAPLERIQIVKGWVDASGGSRERVFDAVVAAGAGVDPATCTPTGNGGAARLCAVWTDPDFDPEQRAFYYARVLENPTCRWSRRLCNDLAVDCDDPDSVPPELGLCCSDEFTDTIQERAWTSPIWYRPEALGAG